MIRGCLFPRSKQGRWCHITQHGPPEPQSGTKAKAYQQKGDDLMEGLLKLMDDDSLYEFSCRAAKRMIANEKEKRKIPVETLKKLSGLLRVRQDWIAGNIGEEELLQAQKEAENIALEATGNLDLVDCEGTRLLWLVETICTEKDCDNWSLELAKKTVHVSEKLGVGLTDIARRLISLPYREYMSRLGS